MRMAERSNLIHSEWNELQLQHESGYSAEWKFDDLNSDRYGQLNGLDGNVHTACDRDKQLLEPLH